MYAFQSRFFRRASETPLGARKSGRTTRSQFSSQLPHSASWPSPPYRVVRIPSRSRSRGAFGSARGEVPGRRSCVRARPREGEEEAGSGQLGRSSSGGERRERHRTTRSCASPAESLKVRPFRPSCTSSPILPEATHSRRERSVNVLCGARAFLPPRLFAALTKRNRERRRAGHSQTCPQPSSAGRFRSCSCAD